MLNFIRQWQDNPPTWGMRIGIQENSTEEELKEQKWKKKFRGQLQEYQKQSLDTTE
jgi:hypothetical protein